MTNILSPSHWIGGSAVGEELEAVAVVPLVPSADMAGLCVTLSRLRRGARVRKATGALWDRTDLAQQR